MRPPHLRDFGITAEEYEDYKAAPARLEAEAYKTADGAAVVVWFEGEHPLVSWSPGRDGEIPDAGYAPSEYRLKPWPNEAQSGAWCPRLTGDHNAGFEVGRVAGWRSLPVAPWDAIPSVLTRGLTHRPDSAFVEVSNRPLRERLRARGDTILLTTHFSGADEARLEWSLAAELSVGRT